MWSNGCFPLLINLYRANITYTINYNINFSLYAYILSRIINIFCYKYNYNYNYKLFKLIENDNSENKVDSLANLLNQRGAMSSVAISAEVT